MRAAAPSLSGQPPEEIRLNGRQTGQGNPRGRLPRPQSALVGRAKPKLNSQIAALDVIAISQGSLGNALAVDTCEGRRICCEKKPIRLGEEDLELLIPDPRGFDSPVRARSTPHSKRETPRLRDRPCLASRQDAQKDHFVTSPRAIG